MLIGDWSSDVCSSDLHVDRVRLAQLPGPRHEGIGPGGQCADRADIHQVAGQLGGHRLLQGGDLCILAAVHQAELLDAGDLGGEAHAAGALDAAGHDRLDQRPHVLLGDRALVLGEAAAVEAVGHGLVLQVALAALVADRAVERMVDEQELHDAVARLLHLVGVGLDHHALADRHGAGGDRLGRTLHLDQAHAAVAGHRQAVVVAESRNLDAGELAGLQDRQALCDLDLLAVDRQLRHRSPPTPPPLWRSEEHTSELQSLLRTSYAVFSFTKKTDFLNTYT